MANRKSKACATRNSLKTGDNTIQNRSVDWWNEVNSGNLVILVNLVILIRLRGT
jgi:hypothetical protein